jgi:hypothetical protein
MASARLGPERSERIRRWIREKWRHGCPACDGRSLTISGELYEMPAVFTRDLGSSHGAFAGVPVVCDNCGLTQFVSAIVLGLLPPKIMGDAVELLPENES